MNSHQFRHFSDFDRTHVGGRSRLDQWTGKVRKRYNSFVNHANQAITLYSTSSSLATATMELVYAIDEIKRLAQLRLYELQQLTGERFDVNGDGPGSADFICSNACKFLYAVYLARTELMVWQCLMKRFTCVTEPHDVVKSTAPILSNRTDDEPAWFEFCRIVEDRLHEDDFTDRVLGQDAHSQFLILHDEGLYVFQEHWIPQPDSGGVSLCAPIFADSPDYGYHGSYKYSLARRS